MPASLWDVDLAESDHFRFALGAADESYVFNGSGQEIALEDLVVGYSEFASGRAVPIVNPIKDSMRTKTTPQTRKVAAAVYLPVPGIDRDTANEIGNSFAEWLSRCGSTVRVHHALVAPGERAEFDV